MVDSCSVLGSQCKYGASPGSHWALGCSDALWRAIDPERQRNPNVAILLQLSLCVPWAAHV